MDKNQAIGFTLIAFMLVLYFWLSPKTANKPIVTPQTITQTIPNKTIDTVAKETIVKDTNGLQKQFGAFWKSSTGNDESIILENNDVKVSLNSQGGKLKEVLLKNYKTYHQKPLILLDDAQNKMSFLLSTNSGLVDLSKIYFTSTKSVKGDTNIISFRANISENKYFEQTYSLGKTGYEIGYKLKAVGLDDILKNEPLQFYWTDAFRNVEKDILETRKMSFVTYYTNDESFEKTSEITKDPEEVKVQKPLKWIAFKQKFFLTGIIADQTLQAPTIKVSQDESKEIVKTFSADILLPIQDIKTGKANYHFYFGPNDYQIVKNITDGFGKNVYLGYPVINLVSRFGIVPLFHLLESFITNYGLLIVILVIIIRIILLPLNYKSYISMAKTRVLAPEMAGIKEKFPDDLPKQQQETMKLYQQVGVNPISGCIPLLLQMPILLALFSLFPNLIEFRQKRFLWAEDMSAWDSIAHLPFSIPYYGDHVSLFTILMTLSTLAYTYYNNQMTAGTMQQGPVNMKVVSYSMPVIFMFILNSLPAGLSFYYFVANIASIAQQLLIRKFVNEDKIKLVLEENKLKNKDKKKSKFQERIDAAMRSAEEQKKLNEGNKKKKP